MKYFFLIFAVLLYRSPLIAESVKVSFRVDMTAVTIKDKKTVGISGNAAPLSWDKLFPLTDDDNDGIYTGEVTFRKAGTIAFKFRYDTQWERGENRTIFLKESNNEIVVAQWNKLPFVGFFNFDYEGKIIPMQERMQRGEQPVNGVGLCIMRGGQVDTIANWGFRDAAQKLPVDAHTLFQMGGITPPVTAFAVLRACDQKLIDLDQPINKYLKRWQFPCAKGEKTSNTSIRDLLTGKVSLGSKSKPTGYKAGRRLPTALQTLRGEKPSQEKALRIKSTPYYSFYPPLVLQVLLEDIYNLPFAEVLQQQVFAPLGMTESFCAIELTAAQRRNFAIGYDKKDRPVPGDYYRYPEQGFGGMWSTATDYAKFIQYLVKAARGEDNTLLSQSLANAAVVPNNGQRPLAFPQGDNEQNYFGGAPQGYRTQVEFSVKENWVCVALLNSWENWRFMLGVQGKAQQYAQRK